MEPILVPVAFDAGMRTFQRSEAFHAMIKSHMSKHTTLPELLNQL